MGIPSELRDAWARRTKPVVIASPQEPRVAEAESTVQEAVLAGVQSACIAGAIAAVPVLVGCRVIPWAKRNLNYTGQTLLISAATISGFFIAADKTILERAKENSLAKFDKTS